MEQKIFTKSERSRIKSDFDVTHGSWWLRSGFSYITDVGFVSDNGYIYGYYNHVYYGVLPTCTI